MVTAEALYDQYCDAVVNETCKYLLQDVEDMRDDRKQLKEEINELNAVIESAINERQITGKRSLLEGAIEDLAKMDKVLAYMESHNPNSGYLIMRRVSSPYWYTMKPVIYLADPEEAAEACGFFNAHDMTITVLESQ